jgi:hypothetical protein
MKSVHILHDTPGRLRLALPGIAGSKSRALACEEAIRALPGVRHAHASERTGNLLVLYLPSAAAREAIQQRCAAWAAERPAPAARPAHHHGFRPGTLGVLVELLPHLLPLALGSCSGCRLR